MHRKLTALAGAVITLQVAISTVGVLSTPPPTTSAQQPEAYALIDTWEKPAGLSPAGFILDPGGTAVDEGGTVYVVDTGRGQIHVFRDDRFAETWGGPGPALGQLEQPHGIAILGDRLIVADTGNMRLQLFEKDGRPVTAWGSVGRPWDVAVSRDGTVFAADVEGDQIVTLGSDGIRLGTLGGSGSAFGELDAPQAVDVWPDGRMAILDSGNHRVQVWEADGTFASVITNTSLLPNVDIATYGEHNLLVAALRRLASYDLAAGTTVGTSGLRGPAGFSSVAVQPGPNQAITPTIWTSLRQDYHTGLRHYTGADLQNIEEWLELPGPASELVSPRRIAVDGDHVFFLDAWPRILRFSDDGAPLDQIEIDEVTEIVPSGGDMFAASGTTLGRLSWTNSLWQWRSITNTAWFAGLAYDSAADRLLALDLSGQSLHVFGSDGRFVDGRPLNTPAFQSFTDMDRREDGLLLLVNRTSSEVELRSAAGGLMDRWPVRGVPLRVAPDPSGGAFVLTREGWIWKLGPDGTIRAWWDAAGATATGPEGRRSTPSDIALAHDGRLLVLDGRSGRVLVFARDPDAIPEPAPAASGCTFVRDKWAAPPRILLGETVGVTLTISGECFGEGLGADIVLVIDRSGSMKGHKMAAAREAAIAFISEIDFSVSRVGAIWFSYDASIASQLANDPSDVVSAIAGLGEPVGGTNIGAGIAQASSMLTQTGRAGVEKIMIVMTDGRPEGNVVDANQAADGAKAAGIRLFSIGFGSDADPELMKRIASTPEDYYFAPSTAELAGIYTEIARRITGGIVMHTTVITDVVPTNMVYLPGSASPPPVSFTGRTLRWEFQDVREDLQLAYRLRPLVVGTWPTNDEARSRHVDGHDVPGELVFPVPQVVVVAPPRPIYVPMVGGRICRPTQVHADVALIVDTSSSMRGDKLAAAKAAARSFVEILELPLDRAAIIGFNRTATLASGLSGNRGQLLTAIDGLAIIPGTVIDSGLRVAIDELQGPQVRPEGNRVFVLLTDGVNNAGPAPVLATAAEARALGIAIYTVAFGADADRELMRQVAGDPRRAYVAATAADLVRIYREIAWVIPCP